MNNIKENKEKANELRKGEKFQEALLIYRKLWEETGDEFDGAGFLHCLRKLELFDEAIVFADDLIVKHHDFKWCVDEVIWTYIQGVLNKYNDNEPIENIIETAEKIMSFNPNALAIKIIVFKVLKSAKSSKHWEIVNEWVEKIDPDSLNTKPMTDDSGSEGWCDQSLWYNYRIRGFVEKGDESEKDEAINMVDKIIERFPKQRKFFLRLKALAYHKLGNLPESEKNYKYLCSGYKPDWWMLYEYAKVVKDIGHNDDALKLMYKAASSHSKLESMVSLFEDIGMLCNEMDKFEEARSHLVLCKLVRNEKGWNLPESIINTISYLNKKISNNEPLNLKEALSICKSNWHKILGESEKSRNLSVKKRKIKKGLIGRVNLGKIDRPYCFIRTKDNESFFCYKSDLPNEITNGDELTFDAIPSLDKKKNKESWKASNIRYFT